MKQAGGMAQVVELLLSNHEALRPEFKHQYCWKQTNKQTKNCHEPKVKNKFSRNHGKIAFRTLELTYYSKKLLLYFLFLLVGL
jgi:hypothetical protein